MVIIKRLYTFMLQRFIPVLTMTFFISLFVVMMQFLWRFIDDLVGKGLGFGVVAELFWYATLTMVPTALPLAVLLASLMTFGNLGEKFELTAMKAAGVSLFRIMRPLIILMTFIAIGAFFFQNNVLPIAQTKMYTLLFSMRQKSPEVEIPERSFYDQIPGMNLYVEKKNRDTGMLYDMIIYDVTRGMDNARIILADSGKMSFTEDKSHLFLHLYTGELFENVQNGSMGFSSGSYMPFRRESFDDKQVYIAFDANFNRIDESGMRSQYIGKNISELKVAIDSIQEKVDSIGSVYGTEIKTSAYVNVPYFRNEYEGAVRKLVPQKAVHPEKPINIDSAFNKPSASMAKTYINQALSKARRKQQDFEFRGAVLGEQQKLIRQHEIEMQKKFTLSFACIVFFFIGAPLGAIIKKGGLGTPLVISVALFVVYFIFDNMGYKLARDGKMEVTPGIWLSSIVLLPLGVFFTYKAVHDSAVFDFDSYKRFFNRFFSKYLRKNIEKRNIQMKEVVINQPDRDNTIRLLKEFTFKLEDRIAHRKKVSIFKRMFTSTFTPELLNEYEELIVLMSYSRDKYIIQLLNQYPVYPSGHNAKETARISREIYRLATGEELQRDSETSDTAEPTEPTEITETAETAADHETTDNANETDNETENGHEDKA